MHLFNVKTMMSKQRAVVLMDRIRACFPHGRVLKIPVELLLCTSLLVCQQASVESARQLAGTGHYKQAVACLQELLLREPRNAPAHSVLGSVLATVGNRSESLDHLLEAVRLEPDSAKAYDELGVALSHFSELAAARKAFEKALSLDSRLSDAHVNLALLFAQTGDFSEAGRQIDQAIRINDPRGDIAYLHYLRGKVYNEESKFEDAARELKLTLRLKVNFADAWSELGLAQRAALNDKEALKAFEQAVILNPTDPESQYRLGTEFLRFGQFADAVAHLRKANALRPDDRSTLYSLQMAIRKEGRVQEADRVLAELAGLTRKSDKISEDSLLAVQLNNSGVELEKKGDVRAAIEKYRAAQELDPSHPGFRLNHGLALCRLGHWTEGIAEIRQVKNEYPEDTEAARDLYIATDEFNSSLKTPIVAGRGAP